MLIMLSSVVLSACSIPGMGGAETETVPATTTTTDTTDTTKTPETPAEPAKTEEPKTPEITPEKMPEETTNSALPSDTPKAIVEGGVYLPYTSTAVVQAKGDIVLFFYANWCPTCIKVNKNIEENLKKIPKNLTILRVNFDDATELRETYGVTEQHTFIQVDNTGKLIKKWRWESLLSDITAQVQGWAAKADVPDKAVSWF